MNHDAIRRIRLAALAMLALPLLRIAAPAQDLPIWTGSFLDTQNSQSYPFIMVGGNPQNGGTTTVTTYLVPLTVQFKATDGSQQCGSAPVTFSPSQVVYQSESVTQMVIDSPIFTPVPFQQENNAPLQFVDAFQEANFSGEISGSLPYHLKLSSPPSTLQVSTLVIGPGDGEAMYSPINEGGICVGEIYNINYLLGNILMDIGTLQQQGVLNPSDLPIFLTYDVYGGIFQSQHGATDPGAINMQTYVWATYNASSCGESCGQDVSALSHEVAEWADDPSGHTPAPCQHGKSNLEVGDYGGPNLYTYAGATNGFNYHLIDPAMLPLFGAPNGTSLNNWLTFQGEPMQYCDGTP